MMKAIQKFIRAVLEKIRDTLFCKHQWVFNREVQDQNLRTGHEHRSEIYVCGLCGAVKTEEHSSL
jgi:hypothetical protein